MCLCVLELVGVWSSGVFRFAQLGTDPAPLTPWDWAVELIILKLGAAKKTFYSAML